MLEPRGWRLSHLAEAMVIWEMPSTCCIPCLIPPTLMSPCLYTTFFFPHSSLFLQLYLAPWSFLCDCLPQRNFVILSHGGESVVVSKEDWTGHYVTERMLHSIAGSFTTDRQLMSAAGATTYYVFPRVHWLCSHCRWKNFIRICCVMTWSVTYSSIIHIPEVYISNTFFQTIDLNLIHVVLHQSSCKTKDLEAHMFSVSI